MDLFEAADEDDDECVRPEDCGVFSFHAGTEECLLLFVESQEPRCPRDVLRAVDKFCETRHWMMCVGPEKGEIIRGAVRGCRRVCELGSYVGYSAILLADATERVSRVISLEVDPACCEWARRLVRLARLSDRVEIRHADASRLVDELDDEWSSVDFLLVDHQKSRYLEDLIAAAPLLRKGTVVVADNVFVDDTSCSREYLDYVRNSEMFEKSTFYPASLEYSGGTVKDGVEVSIVS